MWMTLEEWEFSSLIGGFHKRLQIYEWGGWCFQEFSSYLILNGKTTQISEHGTGFQNHKLSPRLVAVLSRSHSYIGEGVKLFVRNYEILA